MAGSFRVRAVRCSVLDRAGPGRLELRRCALRPGRHQSRMSLFTDRCTNENRSDGRGGTGRPALTTASRWRDDGVTRAVGGGTMPILITAILLFLLALLIIAGPL